MKFSDIPRFTKWGNWACNYDLLRIPAAIAEWQSEQNLNLTPDFQRERVWTHAQQIAYLEFILQGGKSGREILFNCPGWNRGYTDNFVLVDGLQRLTAVTDFINNKFPVFGEYFLKDFNDSPRGYTRLIFHVNDLSTRREVLQ